MTNRMFEPPEGEPPRPNRAARRRSQKQEEQEFVNYFMYLLTAPHVAWPGWEDLMLRHKDDILLHRLGHAMEIFEQQMCTEFEVMLYISTASMAQPLRQAWVEIYMWLFRRWNPEQADAIDIQEPELDRSQVDHLNRLRGWIYRTQMNHLKTKQRDADGADRKEVAEEKQRLEVEQPRMFDLPDEEEKGE